MFAAATSFMIFTTTESCFIKADIRNAITMVKTLKAAPNATTIPKALQANHPGVALSSIGWDGEVTDNCYGFVRVRAAVPAPKEVVIYFFDVNLSGQRLHPGNERARQLLTGIRKSSLPEESEPGQAPEKNKEAKKNDSNLDETPAKKE